MMRKSSGNRVLLLTYFPIFFGHRRYMIAALSPSSDNMEETVSTLRFASSVKMIKTVATQNKDKKDELIEHLQEALFFRTLRCWDC